jgi:NAD(P)-dependent dehydrogenase (short-subunit alcohol dehydrogenase family)
MHTSLKDKITLVTRVSSGIGREIAQLLAERGARVFGTVRNPQYAHSIRGMEIVRMEVTDDASVNEAEAVWNVLTAKSPRLRYPVGKGVAFSRMRRFVPAGIFDKSFRKQFQLD